MTVAGLEIALLRPWWLLALPLLAALGWWLATRRGGIGDWQRAGDAALIAAMAALGRLERASGRGALWALLAAVALIVLALAGPAVERRDTLSFRNLDGVLFVLDASPSMVEGGRWTEVQTLARFGVASLGTRPGGLIVYAGDAYVASDMTLDHLQLGQTLSLIGPETVPDAGSRPARALRLAAEMLGTAQVLAGDVILVTDGAGLEAESLQAASAIAEQGARLSLVAVDEAGPAFATHAAAGGGRVFGLSEVEALADWLGEDARARLEAQDYPLLFWNDLGRMLLLLALLPLLLLFRRQAA